MWFALRFHNKKETMFVRNSGNHTLTCSITLDNTRCTTLLIHISCLNKRVENQQKHFKIAPTPTIEKPFKMYNNSKKIIVRLAKLMDGWELDNEEDGEKVFTYLPGFRCEGACEFLVKQVEGRGGNNFKCQLIFQQEGSDEQHTIYVITEFALEERPEPVNDPRENSKEAAYPQVTSTTRTHLSNVAGCSTSSAPDESDTGNLEEHSQPPRESKLLSSLRDKRLFLEKVCCRLDTKMPGVGDYRDVCSHYGIDSYEVTAVFEKDKAGPSRALLEHLAAARPRLTVAEFVGVLRKIAGREDVAKLLTEHYNQKHF